MLLTGVLIALSLGLSYAVSVYGFSTGLIAIGGILALALAFVCFARPLLGFYICIFLSFIISVFERLLFGVITLDFAVELLTYIAFFGQIYKKHVQGESFWKGMRHPINYVMLIYVAYLMLDCLNPNGSLGGALFSVRKTAQIVVAYLLALSLLRSYKDIKTFFIFWVVVSGLCGAYACYQQWVGFPAFELNWIYASPVRVDIYQLDNGSFRKFSTLTDPAAFGIFMSISALLTLVTILKVPIKRTKVLFSVALLFELLGMSYSGTRTAIFAVLAGVGLYILMTLNNVKTMLFAVFCALVLGFLMFAPIYGNVTLNRFRSAFHFYKDNSYEVRNTNRARIQPYIHSHPIGGGPMTTGTNGLKYNPNHYLAGFPTDSGFLKSALEYGWVGFFILCLVLFVTLQQGAHTFFKVRSPLARSLLLAAVVTIFGNIVSMYSQIAIGAIPEIYLYYGLVAIIINISKLENKQIANV